MSKNVCKAEVGGCWGESVVFCRLHAGGFRRVFSAWNIVEQREWQPCKTKCFFSFLDECPSAFMYQKYAITVSISNQLFACLYCYNAP